MNRYDRAIQYLTENPHRISEAWGEPDLEMGGSLFLWCDDGTRNGEAGCLTQVKREICRAHSDELTAKILADDRIPMWTEDITLENLYVFKEYQENLDKEFPGRELVETNDN